MQSTRKRKWRCSHDKSSRDCAPHPLARVRTLARECLWRGGIDKMYSRNVNYANIPFATMTNDDRIVVVVFRKISQVFSSFRRKTFRENSRRCVPATVATVACVKNGALGYSLNVDTRIGSATNPRAHWLSAIMICLPSARYRIRGSSWECIFIPFAFQSLLASRLFLFPYPFCIFLPRFTLSTNR